MVKKSDKLYARTFILNKGLVSILKGHPTPIATLWRITDSFIKTDYISGKAILKRFIGFFPFSVVCECFFYLFFKLQHYIEHYANRGTYPMVPGLGVIN